MSDANMGTRTQQPVGDGGTRSSKPVDDFDYALIVVLWDHEDFTGARQIVVENTPVFAPPGAFVRPSPIAIGVHPGPNYERWKATHAGQEPTVGLYPEPDYGGQVMLLAQGAYTPKTLAPYSMRGAIRSVQFNPPPVVRHGQSAPAINSIPMVVTLYEDANFAGRSAVIIEDVPRLPDYVGASFNDIVTSVRVRPGPNYSDGRKARLFRDVNYLGGEAQLGPGDYPSLSALDLNDAVSSIKVS